MVLRVIPVDRWFTTIMDVQSCLGSHPGASVVPIQTIQASTLMFQVCKEKKLLNEM